MSNQDVGASVDGAENPDIGKRVPLNFDIDDRLITLVRVRLEPFSIEMPSQTDVANLWQAHGLKIPMPTQADMERLERKVWETLPKLRKSLSGRGLRLARLAAGGSKQNAPDSEALEWEAKVREMKWDQLVEAMEANGLPVPQQTNPGLRVMQARNILYSKIRREGHLQPTSH